MSPVMTALGPDGMVPYRVDWLSGGPTLTPSDQKPDGILVPGFVDVHIHGAFGIDFMDADQAAMSVLCDRLAELGYEGFLPTTVAASARDVLAAVHSLPPHPLVWGFHLEGPFLSPEFPGAQPPNAITDPMSADQEWSEVWDHPSLKYVTLAPERPGANRLVGRLARRGVVASMGHSNATYLEASAGHVAGAASATHTFNAMRGIHHREAGLAGYVLQADDLFAELIYDRKHVSTEAASLLVRCKPKDRLLAVSDATKAAGLPVGTEITMWGQKCVVGEGDVRLLDSGVLAGSSITLLDAFRNLAEDFGLEAATRACSLNPRVALGNAEPPQVWIEFDPQLSIREIRRAGSLT